MFVANSTAQLQTLELGRCRLEVLFCCVLWFKLANTIPRPQLSANKDKCSTDKYTLLHSLGPCPLRPLVHIS